RYLCRIVVHDPVTANSLLARKTFTSTSILIRTRTLDRERISVQGSFPFVSTFYKASKLEGDLCSELPPTRQGLVRDLTEVAARQVVTLEVLDLEVGVVEEIVELKPELEVQPLRDVSVLVDGHVRLHVAWTTELVDLLVAVGARRWRRELARCKNA